MNEKFFLPITIIFCLTLFIGWYQFIYEPARREILNMELETRRIREVEREIFELKNRHESLEKFIETKEFDLDAARSFLPPTLAQDKFIDELYHAADFCNVQLVSVQTSEINSSNEIQSQVVTVTLETDYISLMNFIREILDGGRLTSLEKISAESSAGKIISCELSFKIFATVT